MRSADQVLTAAEMRGAEDAMMVAGTSVDELMQRAGRGAAQWVWRIASGRPVTVLCGPGNNGGDGYVIAQSLRQRGLAVVVVAPDEPRTQAARAARAMWEGAIASSASPPHGGVFVDCLFGTGLSRALSPEQEQLLEVLVDRHDFTIAVDLPSGVSTDDGALLGQPPKCDLTLALGAWKPAHYLMPALERAGQLRLVDIGIGPVEGSAILSAIPTFGEPARAAHKYSRGLLGVVGGVMTGAALLAAKAAMHGGAGYAKLLSPHSHPAAPAALVVDEAPLPDALADTRWSALLVGPGLGRDADAAARLSAALERRVPTVLDADALHLLDDDFMEGTDTSRLLLTPHEGELTKLCETFGVSGGPKLDKARGLARATGLTILAKGPDTVLAGADGRTAFFPPATSWLSVAGTGDVLAGLAASQLATGLAPFEAAENAVWLHTQAAGLAGPVFTADDLAAAVPAAYASFL